MTTVSAGSGADAPDPGVVRAGAAAAARRRELGISQRSLAADGIINAGALIAFEKGRSWPRDKTRTRLEEVLRWPPGTISRVRYGGAAPGEEAVPRPPSAGGQDAELIAQVVLAAVDSCKLAADTLPAVIDPAFTSRLAPILAELRQLESVAVRSAEVCGVTPALIAALGTVRRHYDTLMLIGAAAPGATLGQRLHACRRRANLTIAETAQAAGVSPEMIEQAEAEATLPTEAAGAIEALIEAINLT